MRSSSTSSEAARVLASLAIAAREGFLDTVTSTVEDLTGKPPASLREIVVASSQDAIAPETVSTAV